MFKRFFAFANSEYFPLVAFVLIAFLCRGGGNHWSASIAVGLLVSGFCAVVAAFRACLSAAWGALTGSAYHLRGRVQE